jgi:hypothetical protein
MITKENKRKRETLCLPLQALFSQLPKTICRPRVELVVSQHQQAPTPSNRQRLQQDPQTDEIQILCSDEHFDTTVFQAQNPQNTTREQERLSLRPIRIRGKGLPPSINKGENRKTKKRKSKP